MPSFSLLQFVLFQMFLLVREGHLDPLIDLLSHPILPELSQTEIILATSARHH
jgi:hypothetical protein